jgi:hypothetical protein
MKHKLRCFFVTVTLRSGNHHAHVDKGDSKEGNNNATTTIKKFSCPNNQPLQ